MLTSSKLKVPSSPARPGQDSDFRFLPLSPAGAVLRPETTVESSKTDDLASNLVRVLDDDGAAVGPWNPHLDVESLRLGLGHMVLTRVFDDRMQLMQRQGKITFYMKSTGEECVSVAPAMALRKDDMVFPSYRNHCPTPYHICR
jgi:2-oxoisovalerate dehydrogenase E1 component alpha subunit